MAISIHWGTKVINVQKSDTTLITLGPPEVRELDLNTFRLALKDLEDSEDGMPFLDTHRHNTEVSVSGLTLSRVIEIINGYTVTFEDGQYAVNLVGANSNVGDVVNFNLVSVRTFNSAGLVTISTGSGLSTDEHNQLMALPDPTDIAIAVFAKAMSGSGSRSFEQIMEIITSAMAGKSSGGGTANVIFRNLDDDTDVIDAVVDANGNRTTVALDV